METWIIVLSTAIIVILVLIAIVYKVVDGLKRMQWVATSLANVSKCNSNQKYQKTINFYSNVDFPSKSLSMIAKMSDFKLNSPKAHNNMQNLSKSQFEQLFLNLNSTQSNNILTPFCIDDTNSTIVFLPVPKSIILQHESTMSFFFQTQIAHSVNQSLYTINFSDLSSILHNNVCKSIWDEFDEKNILFIHSMGRCGSNLLSSVVKKIYQQLNTDTIIVIDETQILRQIAVNYSNILPKDKNGVFEKRSNSMYEYLVDLSLKSLLLPIITAAGGGNNNTVNKNRIKIVIKESSQVMWISMIICKLFPNINHIYLYRNKYDQIDSVCSVSQNVFQSIVGKFFQFCENQKLGQYLLHNIQFKYHLIASLSNGHMIKKSKTINEIYQYKYLAQYTALHWIHQMILAQQLLNEKLFKFSIKYEHLLGVEMMITQDKDNTVNSDDEKYHIGNISDYKQDDDGDESKTSLLLSSKFNENNIGGKCNCDGGRADNSKQTQLTLLSKEKHLINKILKILQRIEWLNKDIDSKEMETMKCKLLDVEFLTNLLKKDSHSKVGGLKSHRKGRQRFVFLKEYHLNAIDDVIKMNTPDNNHNWYNTDSCVLENSI